MVMVHRCRIYGRFNLGGPVGPAAFRCWRKRSLLGFGLPASLGALAALIFRSLGVFARIKKLVEHFCWAATAAGSLMPMAAPVLANGYI